jgi:hypothetical protein
MLPARRPFDPDLITILDQLGEALRAEAKPHGDRAVRPLPGGDPALLEASADAATLLARLIGAIVAFDNGDEDQAEDLIQSTAVLVHGIRANTGL